MIDNFSHEFGGAIYLEDIEVGELKNMLIDGNGSKFKNSGISLRLSNQIDL